MPQKRNINKIWRFQKNGVGTGGEWWLRCRPLSCYFIREYNPWEMRIGKRSKSGEEVEIQSIGWMLTLLPRPQIQIPPFCMSRNMKQKTVRWLWPEVCWVWQQGQSKRPKAPQGRMPKDLRCYRCLIDTSNSIYLNLNWISPSHLYLQLFPP